jgi:hypothetical protein
VSEVFGGCAFPGRRGTALSSRNVGQGLMAELGYLRENRIKEIISLICIHGLTERCRICGQYANAAMCVREMLISCRQ